MSRLARSFDASPEGLSSFFWTVEIYPRCPNCGSDAHLGSIVTGGVSIARTKCEFRSSHENINLDRVVNEILDGAKEFLL